MIDGEELLLGAGQKCQMFQKDIGGLLGARSGSCIFVSLARIAVVDE